MSIYLTITAHPDDEILGFGGSSYLGKIILWDFYYDLFGPIYN